MILKNSTCIRLKELRLEKGLTQRELAKLMNISVNKLRNLEKCTISPTLFELAGLSYYLKARIQYILGTSSIRTIPEDLPYDEYDNYIKKHEKNKRHK